MVHHASLNPPSVLNQVPQLTSSREANTSPDFEMKYFGHKQGLKHSSSLSICASKMSSFSILFVSLLTSLQLHLFKLKIAASLFSFQFVDFFSIVKDFKKKLFSSESSQCVLDFDVQLSLSFSQTFSVFSLEKSLKVLALSKQRSSVIFLLLVL